MGIGSLRMPSSAGLALAVAMLPALGLVGCGLDGGAPYGGMMSALSPHAPMAAQDLRESQLSGLYLLEQALSPEASPSMGQFDPSGDPQVSWRQAVQDLETPGLASRTTVSWLVDTGNTFARHFLTFTHKRYAAPGAPLPAPGAISHDFDNDTLFTAFYDPTQMDDNFHSWFIGIADAPVGADGHLVLPSPYAQGQVVNQYSDDPTYSGNAFNTDPFFLVTVCVITFGQHDASGGPLAGGEGPDVIYKVQITGCSGNDAFNGTRW